MMPATPPPAFWRNLPPLPTAITTPTPTPTATATVRATSTPATPAPPPPSGAAPFSTSCPARLEQSHFATKLPLLRFPNELLLLIAEDLSTPDLNAFSQCSARLYSLLTPSLHTRGLMVLPCDGESVLHWAAAKGYQSLVERLLDGGADIELPTHYYKQTPLFHAVQADRVDIVRCLLARGADINRRDCQADTVLRTALSNAHAPLVALLLEAGADVSARNKFGETPLHLAPFKVAPVVRLLLEAGADVAARDGSGHAPLHLAAQYGTAEVVALLLAHAAAVDEKDSYGLTPLHRAVRNADDAVMKLLVAVSADVNILDDEGATPLHTAADAKSAPKVLYLLAHGADARVRDAAAQTALHRATATTIGRRRMKETLLGQQPIVTALLDAGVDVNMQDARGRSAIHYAAQLECAGVLNVLLARGAHAGMRDRHERTALHYAAWHGNEVLAAILLARDDVTITETNLRGKSALHYAALSATRWSESSEALTRLLLARGFDVDHQDASGKTPLYYALTEGNTQVALALLDAGCDLSITTTDALTPLHAAAKSRYAAPLLPTLLALGAARDARDRDGKTPLFHALWFDSLDAAGALLAAGADASIAAADGTTPLHLAARKGLPHLLPRLLALGAVVDARDAAGETPLLAGLAGALQDRWTVVEALLNAGADAAASDAVGQTALHILATRPGVGFVAGTDAVRRGVEMLVRHGASFEARDAAGRTPAAVAAGLARGEIVGLFEDVAASGGVVSDEEGEGEGETGKGEW